MATNQPEDEPMGHDCDDWRDGACSRCERNRERAELIERVRRNNAARVTRWDDRP